MIGKYEVTQEQYRKVIGKNPSKYMKSSDAAQHPVEQITWYDSVLFCNVLSEREGLQKVYIMNGRYVWADFSKNGYRLPTEAEWEYAALGGSLTRKYIYSGSDDIDQVAWHEGNSKDTTHVVGMKAPNELGLYDMSGNVQEWCWDFFGYYRTEPLANPAGWSFGNNRVKRGGSYDISAFYARSGSRVSLDPIYNDCDTGFRLVRRP